MNNSEVAYGCTCSSRSIKIECIFTILFFFSTLFDRIFVNLSFENTHAPIIDLKTFDNVQRIRGNVKRYPDGWG